MPWSQTLGIDAGELAPGASVYQAIADAIEAQVRSGVLAHGDRLPATDAIARQFKVTVPTAQHALSLLMERGLLKRRPRHGTTIDSSGASRCVCAAFGVNPFQIESFFDRLLLQELDKAFKRHGISLDCRLSLGGSDFKANIARLAEDAEKGRFACLLPLHASPELMTWLAGRRGLRWTWHSHVDHYQAAFLAVDHLLSKGFRRLLCVSMFPPDYYPEPAINKEFEGVLDAFAKHGLQAPEPPLLYWGKFEADGYDGVRKLLSSGEPLPDALFINHDVLAKGALRALAEQGLAPGREIAFASHSNKGDLFPWPPAVARVEIDPADMAEATACHIERNFLSGDGDIAAESPYVPPRLIDPAAAHTEI